MVTGKFHNYDPDSTKTSLHKLRPLTPNIYTKSLSILDGDVGLSELFKDHCLPIIYATLFALNISVWVTTLATLRLCAYFDVLSPLHIVLQTWVVLVSGIFLVWKNVELYYGTHPRRETFKQLQQGGVFDSTPTATELLLTTITLLSIVVEPLQSLPTGFVLILGDVLISGFLAWMIYRPRTGPIRAGPAEVNEDTATFSSSKGVQWEATRARRISAVPSSSAVSTESGKLTTQELATSTSQTSAATAVRSEFLNAARRDSVEAMVDEAISSSRQAQSILITMLDPRNSEPLGLDDKVTPILRDFGRNLAAEGEEKALAGASGSLQGAQGSIVIAKVMLKHVRHLRSRASGGYPRPSKSSVKSYAQLTFEWDLLHCAHKLYEDRLCVTMAGATLIGQTGTNLTPSNIVSMVRELSWVPPYLISLVRDAEFSKSDVIKCFVESQIGETWNWWPFAPASCQLRPGYHRLLWESVCAPATVLCSCC